MAFNGDDISLKRRVSFFGLLSMCIGLNIGGSLFALTGLAADIAGPALPFAMILSSIPVLLAVIPYGIMTSAWPTTSATYRYIQLFSPHIALVTLLTMAVCILIGGQPLYALTFGVFLEELLPVNPVISGIIVLTIFYVVNLVGINFTAKVQTFLFIILLTALGIFIFKGLGNIQTGNFENIFKNGIGNTFAAAGLLYTFCAGGFFVIDIGDEVLKANKNFPRVLFLGVITVIILYTIIHIITIGVFRGEMMKDVSLIIIAGSFMSKSLLSFFIIGGALVACATTINIIYSVVSRGMLVVAREGLLPSFLGNINQSFGTPHWSLTISYLFSILALIGIPSLMFFGSMLNLGIVLSVTMVVISCGVIYSRDSKIMKKTAARFSTLFLKIICSIVVLLNIGIIVFFVFAISKSALVFLAILTLIFLYSIIRKQRFKLIHASVRKQFLHNLASVDE